MSLALSPDAPRHARRWLERYVDAIEESLLDDLRILTSELVTNAVQHSGQPEGDPIEIAATVSDKVIRVEVTDGGAGVKHLHARSQHPPSGLAHLALLSDRWSSEITNSFRVWFEIDVRPNSILRRVSPVSPPWLSDQPALHT